MSAPVSEGEVTDKDDTYDATDGKTMISSGGKMEIKKGTVPNAETAMTVNSDGECKIEETGGGARPATPSSKQVSPPPGAHTCCCV